MCSAMRLQVGSMPRLRSVGLAICAGRLQGACNRHAISTAHAICARGA